MKFWRNAFVCVIVSLLLWWLFPTRILWEKLATALANPVGVAWVLLGIVCAVAIVGKQKLISLTAVTAWVVLTLGGNMYVGRLALMSLERDFLECERQGNERFSTVVILGGGANSDFNGVAQFDAAGDRVGRAAELYHAQRADRFICTGSQIEGMDLNDGRATGRLSAELLMRLGVPADRIQTVGGRTTSEEMKSLASMIDGTTEVGLITSASHMRRALSLAKKAGLKFTPLPADFSARRNLRPLAIDIVPTAYGLDMSSRAAKEYLARIVGR